MQTWDDILATAVVGTDQREFKLAVREDELGRLLAQVSDTDREGFLLTAASVVSLYRSAGVAPPADTQPADEACTRDEMSRAGVSSGQHLWSMLNGAFSELLPEWLTAMKKAGKRVPEEHLPPLLLYAVNEFSLHSLIPDVLGQRGQWLAAQNPEWSYAIRRDDKEVWETGSRVQRLALLENLRNVDPSKARELLATTWSQESAKDRVAFLEKLSTGVSSADEEFLNEALQDRSVEVRRAARALIVRLPNSNFSRRLQQLANQLLTFKKPLIGKARIEVAMPEDPIAWLKENGIEIDNPPRNATKSVGPKAWSLKEFISLIPITHWNELWQKPAIEIIRAGEESEWRESFMLGFLNAVHRDRDPDWLEALVRFTSADQEQPQLIELAAYLPPARLEALILHAFKSESGELFDGHPAFRLLKVNHNEWSDQLSRTVITSVKKRINQGKDNNLDWQTKATLKQFARYISPALYDELASGWPTESNSWPGWAKGVDAFQSLLAFRRDMHQAISEKEEQL
ncbi:MAG TPA: DUF5691 domain-containing protein [Pyrinomonadaceae bacterium]|nr:DUF5691 domain-containing protein [Pyrinomonadaceae bacterium]